MHTWYKPLKRRGRVLDLRLSNSTVDGAESLSDEQDVVRVHHDLPKVADTRLLHRLEVLLLGDPPNDGHVHFVVINKVSQNETCEVLQISPKTIGKGELLRVSPLQCAA